MSQLVSELARFRGEASRLEVELMASNRRAELLGMHVFDVIIVVVVVLALFRNLFVYIVG